MTVLIVLTLFLVPFALLGLVLAMSTFEERLADTVAARLRDRTQTQSGSLGSPIAAQGNPSAPLPPLG